MDISNLWTLQVMMFFLVAAGAILKSTGILKDDAKGILTDLVLYFFLPCNIINSFRMEFNLDILRKFAVVLAYFPAGAVGVLYSQQSCFITINRRK